jgi:histidine triad (HIT) family protein
MNSCAFCSIVEGVEVASMVYSDDKIMAFLDIQPVNPGHVLIVPRVHAAQLSELDPETGGHMFKVAMRVAAAVRRSGVKCEGVSLHLADGEAASQEILHVHLHVIPRFRGDGFGFRFGPDYSIKRSRLELDEIAENIRKAMP